MENIELFLEAFDTKKDDLYPTINMKPGSKMPQIFLIKNGEDNNLIVRLMALSNDGDKLKVLTPSDKNVIVELMSINDRGRHVVLQGGLGANPFKTIVTIFDKVFDSLNLQIVDSIMFRFQTKKLKGQSKSIIRILERLALVRGKGKFVPLKELSNFTNKYTYVALHKKKLDISDIPGGQNVSDDYEKSGEKYIDKSGKEVSKFEVVADAISKTLNKIPEKEAINKTRLSRREIMNAQYSTLNVDLKDEKLEQYNEIINKNVIYKIDENTVSSEIQEEINKIISGKNYTQKYVDMVISGEYPKDQDHLKYVVRNIRENFKYENKYYIEDKDLHEHFRISAKMLDGLNTTNSYQKMLDFAAYVQKMDDLNEIQKGKIVRDTYSFLMTDFIKDVVKTFEDTTPKTVHKVQHGTLALSDYTGSFYDEINGYLLGREEPAPTILNRISQIDEVFKEAGVKLDKGTIVYRGQNLQKQIAKQTIEQKIFLFKNYVSASLLPSIFTGQGFADSKEALVSTDEIDANDVEKGVDRVDKSTNRNMDVGFVIKGADKIKVVIPGEISGIGTEYEVILPRGLALKFDKFKFSELDKSRMVVVSSIVDPDLLDESETIYDGDVLFESSEIVEIDKNKLSFSYFSINESEKENDDGLQLLANIFVNNSK